MEKTNQASGKKNETPHRSLTVCRLCGNAYLQGLNHESLHVVAHLPQTCKILGIVEKIADFVESVL